MILLKRSLKAIAIIKLEKNCSSVIILSQHTEKIFLRNRIAIVLLLFLAIAGKKKVPAYVVFCDAALRDMARRRPSTPDDFLEVKGIGQAKCKQYGKVVLAAIKDYCHANSLE